MEQLVQYHINVQRTFWYHLTILLTVGVSTMLTACADMEHLVEPESPPPGILASSLLNNRWRVVEMMYQGESAPFKIFGSIHLNFDRAGSLTLRWENCPGNTAGWAVDYRENQHYRLWRGMSAAADCGATILAANPRSSCEELIGVAAASEDMCIQAINERYGIVLDVIRSTEAYELAQDVLTLRGPEAEVRLVLDNP